jgi:hypothetical protein
MAVFSINPKRLQIQSSDVFQYSFSYSKFILVIYLPRNLIIENIPLFKSLGVTFFIKIISTNSLLFFDI